MKQRLRENCRLSVNVNKIATLRNSRGGALPNVVTCASDLVKFGAEGITVHPRPDERHIRTKDVFKLAALLKKINRRRSARAQIEYNIEGYPNARYLKLVEQVLPDQATLVPDPPDAITSNAGWRLQANEPFLRKIILRLRKNRIRSSLFIDPFKCTGTELAALKRLSPDRVELYTERYASDFESPSHRTTLEQYQKISREIERLGIAINAGHDLNSRNLGALLKSIPQVVEVSIGHALISEALYLGFRRTIQLYKRKIRSVRRRC